MRLRLQATHSHDMIWVSNADSLSPDRHRGFSFSDYIMAVKAMRDPELKVRTNRRAYILPGQIAMYLVKQLTGASLEEIGRQFGGRHYTTVLHAISKIEAMRRTDQALNSTIMLFVNTSALHLDGIS